MKIDAHDPPNLEKYKNNNRLITSARKIVLQISEAYNLNASIRLWDGSLIPLGSNVKSELAITLNHPGVLPSLLRKPKLNHLIHHYIHGHIGVEGGHLADLVQHISVKNSRKRLKQINKRRLFRSMLPLLVAPGISAGSSHKYLGDEKGENRSSRDNSDYVSFHYDVSNEFYEIFLGPEMAYTCAYFKDAANSLENAQRDKLEMICRKLRLRHGERFLDIGCGWGGLAIYAAQNYGVQVHGITLSNEQLTYAQNMVKALGLSDRVTIEYKDYSELTGQYDKIASIGMVEAIGLNNFPNYLTIIRSILADGGLYLNHATARPAKKIMKRYGKRREQRLIRNFIFPGGELDDIGNTILALEKNGFEVHDVESWRQHYTHTFQVWNDRLYQNREKAIRLVGADVYNIWVAYLSGVYLAFSRGNLRKYQTLVSKKTKGAPPIPLTREDLYS